jgi:hypothetical protein
LSADPIEPLIDEQLVDELAALLRAHDVPSGGAAPRLDD